MRGCFLLLTIFSYSVLAFDCKWWQVPVKAHDVSEHTRNGSDVKSYHRFEHCREKWENGDKFGPSLENEKPFGWPHKETFKTWNDADAWVLIQVLADMPSWMVLDKFKYYRGENSVFKGNPASSSNQKHIVIYDLFFRSKNKREILAHEFSHAGVRLSTSELEDFASLSGWTYRIGKNSKVYEIPPKNLIQSDSSVEKQEDFSNYFGLFIDNPEFVKKFNPKAYDFLSKRYGK